MAIPRLMGGGFCFGAPIALVLLQMSGVGAAAQMRQAPPAYRIASFYDRFTDTTRVTFSLKAGSRPFGLGSRAWLDVAFAYRGRQPQELPELVRITIESSTPAPKGSWAFGGPKRLHIRSDGPFHLELVAAGYNRRVVRSAQPQFQDALSYLMTPGQVRSAAAQPVLQVKVGNARFRLDDDGMEMLREASRRMTGPYP